MVKNCIISEILITRGIPAIPDDRSSVQVVAIQTTGATFQINNDLLYVPDVTLSMNDNVNFLENIKQGFKRTISWNKFRSDITTLIQNNNLADWSKN